MRFYLYKYIFKRSDKLLKKLTAIPTINSQERKSIFDPFTTVIFYYKN